MGKILVEVCIISARGLRHKVSIFKHQWFAVGWVDPNSKYCTKVDASGNQNPSWKTKFSILVDNSDPKFVDLALHIEVYSREPIFLREKLRGTATILLKEFLNKYAGNQGGSELKTEEVGSCHLRKGKSNKPEGFIDFSIRVTDETEEGQNPTLGNGEGFLLRSQDEGVTLARTGGSAQAYPQYLQPLAPHSGPTSHSELILPYSHPAPYTAKFSSPALATRRNYPPADGPSTGYQRPQIPPPPLPPSNVGYVPTFIPGTNYLHPHQSYVNIPSSGEHGNSARPGFAMGVGGGALAAGAMIFSDDFMSSFGYPASLQDATLTISADPPF